MDFGLSEEQLLLQQTLRRFIEEEMPVSRVRKAVADEHGADDGAWKSLAELGVAGILVPEEFGGSGLGLLDAVVAAESLAWGVVPAPMLGSGIMAPVALAAAGTAAQQAKWLPSIAAGECRVGIAATELMSRREGAGIEERASRLHGKALMVIDSGFADTYLVAIGSVNAADSAPQSLALVDANASGLTRAPLTTIDRTRSFGELIFDGVEVEDWIGAPGEGADANRRMLTAGRVALAADLLGASDRAIELAVEYAGKREQFGRVIASFQAVKHMCAEMIAELEPARSLVWYAAHAFDEQSSNRAADSFEEVRLVAAHAKAHLAEIGREIVRTATEVHGGIGFTEEQNLHYWFKRVGVDRQLLGTSDQLREEAARLQGWSAA